MVEHCTTATGRSGAWLLAALAAVVLVVGCAEKQTTPTQDFEGCRSDGTCQDLCQSDAQCPGDEVCFEGQCVQPQEPRPECTDDAQCPDGQRCQNEQCVPEDPPEDSDQDGLTDDQDNCPQIANAGQEDLDNDGRGDLCDDDLDGDQIINRIDNCPSTHNPMQEDPDGDGLGVACDGGTLQRPFALTRGVYGQQLDTRPRPDAASASCGGQGAPEIVYTVALRAGERLNVSARAEHALAIAIFEGPADGLQELDCADTGSLQFTAASTGVHTLIIDGAAAGDAGPLTIDAAVVADPSDEQASLDAPDDAAAIWTDFIDDDALADVAAVHPQNNTISIRLGTQDGQLTDPVIIPAGGDNPVAVWGGDVDRDGDPDLLVALEGTNQVALHLNQSQNGAVNFGAPATFDVGAGPAAVWGGDVDRDGDIDLVVANQASNNASVLLGDGVGGFAPGATLETGAGPVAVWGGDVDRDGDIDLALADFDGGVGTTVSIIRGLGDGSFAPREAISTGAGPVAVWGGDVDNDGLPEISVVHDGATVGGLMTVFANDGGQFERFTSHTIGAGPVAVWGGDVDRDGDLDFVTANNTDSSLSVLLGDGQGGLSEARRLQTNQPPNYVWGQDLNQDAVPELLVPGTGGFNLFISDAQSFSAAASLQAEGLEGVWGGDVDRDGNVDMAFVNTADNTVSVRRGLGNGGFGAEEVFDVGQDPIAVWGGDVDRDGGIDLIVANQGQIGDTTGVISLLRSQGDGTLAQPISLTTDTIPMGVWADEDFNGDGLPDIAVATRGGNSVSVLLATGPGLFEDGHISIPVGAEPTSVWGGDVDRDGNLDLATSNFADNTISVALGDGQGSFAAPQTLAIDGMGPMSLWGDDLDGDGNIDFATRNAMSGTMSVLIGIGDGGFNAPDTFNTGAGRGQVWGGDITDDGLPDLVTSSDDGVTVFTGYANGGFAGQRSLAQGATWVWGEDFDGDGSPDLATTNDQGASVQLSRLANPALAAAARVQSADLPPCPTTDVDGRIDVLQATIDFRTGDLAENCRVDRIEVTVDYEARQQSDVAIRMSGEHLSAERRSATLVASFAPLPGPGRWRPEHLPALARFEGAPAKGLWRLSADSGRCRRDDALCLPLFSSVTLHINPQPNDPFEGAGAFCVSVADQPDTLQSACRWDGQELEGNIDRDTDKDVMLLDIGGQSVLEAGQTLELTMTTPGAGALAPEMSLLAYGARLPLARATNSGPDQWILTWTATEAFAGRYLILNIAPRPGTEPPASYTLNAQIR